MPKELRTGHHEVFDEMVTARLEKGGETFEILVQPDAVEKIRAGEDVDLVESLAVDAVFRDVKKGLRASEEKMKAVLGTDDPVRAAEVIIKTGEVHLSTEQRRALQELKRKQIIAYIAANAVNPQTGTPHPPQRLELALQEAKVHIDPIVPVARQVERVLTALRPLLPLSMEKLRLAVKLPPAEAGKAYGEIRAAGKVVQEEWQTDGAWIGVVEIPAGLQGEFLDRLNERTQGNVETRLLKEGA